MSTQKTVAPAKTKYEDCVRAAIAPVDRRMDCWRWANREHLYIDREELLESMSARACKHIIVDTRDDDVAGGKIYGAIHIADKSFNERSVLQILSQARQLQTPPATPQVKAQHASSGAGLLTGSATSSILVVFHCM